MKTSSHPDTRMSRRRIRQQFFQHTVEDANGGSPGLVNMGWWGTSQQPAGRAVLDDSIAPQRMNSATRKV